MPPKKQAKLKETAAKFQKYSLDFKGPYEPVQSVKMMLGVLETLSIENGDQGKYLSHLGSKRWLP